MIDKLINFSIRNKLLIGLMVIGLIAWGGYSATQLPIDAVPDITNNQVQVITITPSLAAQEVERLITFPVEITMATIPGIEEIRSFSRFGLSVVTIVFEEDIDIYWARQQVGERLAEAKSQIPDGIGSPEMAPVTTGLGEIYQYVVHTKKGYESKYSPMELRTIQDWIIKRQLLGTSGVADVSSFGGYLKQYEISINPEKLRSINISITDIFRSLEKNNQNTGGAYIDKSPHAYFIRSEGMVGGIDDIEKIVVKTNSEGIPILISDVAEVRLGSSVRYGASTRNGEGEVVSAVVMMLKGENSAQVIQNIKARIKQIEKTLPEGVVIEPFLDRTKLVNNAIGTVSKNLIEGALIVIFILIVFLGNARAGLVVASVIPLSMIFAFGMMNLFGVSGNLMSLGAIDFGLIVDGAVIIVESIVHRILVYQRNQGGQNALTQDMMNQQVYNATSKIRNSAAFGEIIILIVYLPILALVGVEGKMFRPMAQTVSFAILGAFILSLTYVPMMSSLVLSRKPSLKKNISDRLMEVFQKGYSPVIKFALARKRIVSILSLIAVVASLFAFTNLGGEFIPSLDEGDFAVETRVMTGSSLSVTIDAATKAEKILLDNFPEVEQVVGKIGSGEIPTDPMPIEACDLMIILKDQDEWVSANSREELADKMSEALAVIPGVTFGFQQPIQMRFNELMTGARQDIVIKVYGEDLDKLSKYAGQVGRLVQTVQGAEDLYVEQVTGLPQIQVEYNRNEIARYGLNIEDVNTTIQAAFAGKKTGTVYEGERKFDLVVRFDNAHRKNLEDVSNLFVTTPNGHQIPLNQLADVSFKVGPSQIQRDDSKRRITIGFNVRNRDIESTVNEIRNKISDQIHFDAGYYPTFGGQFENLIAARNRLMIAIPVALLLILVLLFFTFKSIKQTALIFTAIPFSAIGGIFALSLRDMPFSISAGVGFIALFGVSVLNGIVLIGEFNRLKKNGITDIAQRVLMGTEIRLRPVLMTAMVASFGFFPMALSGSAGAEVQRPLATVVIGGLLTATVLTLVVLPVLYVYFEEGFFRKKVNLKTLVWIPLLFLPFTGSTQSSDSTLSLDQCIEIALQNNTAIHSAQLEIEKAEELKKTSFDLEKTDFLWQRGQINTWEFKDNFFELNQSFAFPTYYSKSASVAKGQIKTSQLQRQVLVNEMIAEVKYAYYDIVYLKKKQQLYVRLDSLYASYSNAANIRFQNGESDALEQLSAQTRSMQISNALLLIQSEISIAQTKLGTLLHSDKSISIKSDIAQKIELDLPPDIAESELQHNPGLQYNQQLISLQEAQKDMEASKLLPDLSVGYFNGSMIGPQPVRGVDRYFTSKERFTGFLVGVSVPIWSKPYTSRIKAEKIGVDIAKSNFDDYQNHLNGAYQIALQEYLKNKNQINFFEQKALKQADLILRHANLAFMNGSIGYIEFVQTMNQGIEIQLEYLDILNSYNQSIIRIEQLNGTEGNR